MIFLFYPCEDNPENVEWHKPLTGIKQVKASKFHFYIEKAASGGTVTHES